MRKIYLSKIKRNNWSKLFLRYIKLYISRIITKPITGPIFGVLILTYRCNLKCNICFLPKRVKESNEWTTNEIKNIIDKFSEMGVLGIEFSGGEPLLIDNIFTLIDYAKSKGLITHLSTNGVFLKENAEKIVLSYLDSVSISLDGSKDEIHNNIRGESYKNIVEGISTLLHQRNIHKKDMEVKIITCVNKNNFLDLKNVIKLAEELKVDKIGFIPFHKIDTIAGQSNIVNSGEFCKIMKEICNSNLIENSSSYISLFENYFRGRKSPVACYAPWTTIIVDCYGNVFFCPYHLQKNISIGNIKNISLPALWYNNKINNIRRELKSCRECLWNCSTEISLLFKPIFLFISLIKSLK